jgi:hypothetical protein
MMRMVRWAALVSALLVCHATDARAQMSFESFRGYLTGHIGSTLGGDVSSARVTGGGSVSVQEATGWGAEFDFGRATKVDVDAQPLALTTYMVNMAYISPVGHIRPFAIAGGGVYQADGCACAQPSKTYDLGLNGGGGVFFLANDVIGFRADARYFWSAGDHPELNRPDHLNHWRLTVGFTYLWTIAP